MKQLFAAAALAAFMATAPQAALAEEIDMRTFTCKAFSALPAEGRSMVVAWLQGFETGDDEELVLDFEEVREDARTMVEVCAKDPSEPLLEVLEKAFQ
jgi:hypothetical protein